MQLQKRSMKMYILLNCLTLGIYGFIVNQQISKEINTFCKGDGEEPRLSYAGAVMVRGISTFLGLVIGFIVGLVAQNWVLNQIGLGFIYYFDGMGGVKAIAVFGSMLVFGIIFTLIGSIITGIYLNYWWYKQGNRLKMNAYRYKLQVKESGTDIFLFRKVINIFFLPITVIVITLSLLIPILIVWLITLANSLGAYVAAVIIMTVFAIPLMLFGCELTTGSLFSFFFITKNLDRYADVYQNGAEPFNSMEYEYYPSIENHYINSLPDIVKVENVDKRSGSGDPETNYLSGRLIGLKGTFAGYDFDMSSGEEIVIGKDAKMANVVIDTAYKEISRKHVGIKYDIFQKVYLVTDYSSNGTWVNNQKLQPGVETIQHCGSILRLANDKNMFKLD